MRFYCDGCAHLSLLFQGHTTERDPPGKSSPKPSNLFIRQKSDNKKAQTHTFGSRYLAVGGGLPLERVGVKKFGVQFEAQQNKPGLFAGYPGILTGCPRGALVIASRNLFLCYNFHGKPVWGAPSQGEGMCHFTSRPLKKPLDV